MEIPSGYKEVYQEAESDTVLKLQMVMYGLVQAARQWFKRLSDVLITLGFTPCESDPCLMYRINEKGLCIIFNVCRRQSHRWKRHSNRTSDRRN